MRNPNPSPTPNPHLRDNRQVCKSAPGQGRGNSPRGGASSSRAAAGATAPSYRVGFPLQTCADGCDCGAVEPPEEHRLAYYRVLPNYGRTDSKPSSSGFNPNPPGGSREPYPYLQFLLDFWDNLPNVILFTQDDCPQRRCMWMQTVQRSIDMLQDWRQHWGSAHRITRANCMCTYMVENVYGPRYYWYGWMATLQQGVFNQSFEKRPHKNIVSWPQDANFAVGAATVKAVPRWFYELLLKLHVTEKWCHGGSIHWAHAMERMWFEIFDPGTPKLKTWLTERTRPLPPRLGCLASALEGGGGGGGGGGAKRAAKGARDA